MTTIPTSSGPTLPGDGVDAARELADALVEALGVEPATRIAKALDARVGDLDERVEALLQRSEAAFERLKSGRLGLDDPAQPLKDSLLTPDALDDHLAGVDVVRHGSEGKGSVGSASDDPATHTVADFVAGLIYGGDYSADTQYEAIREVQREVAIQVATAICERIDRYEHNRVGWSMQTLENALIRDGAAVSVTKRREKASKRAGWVTELRHERAMQRFFADGTIPADARAVSMCSCGSRAFTFAEDDYDFFREFDEAHAYCGEETAC